MTVKELSEFLAKCDGNKSVLIVEIADSTISLKPVAGAGVADTGELLISIGV